MKRIRSRGLAVALLAGALSVLGVGTSAAHSPSDKQGDNPIADLACALQGGHGQGQGGGGQGDCTQKPKEGGDDPVSQIACTLQMKQGECQSKPGGGEGGGSGGGSGGSPSHPPQSQPTAGGDDPISKLMCGLQNGGKGGDCQQKPKPSFLPTDG